MKAGSYCNFHNHEKPTLWRSGSNDTQDLDLTIIQSLEIVLLAVTILSDRSRILKLVKLGALPRKKKKQETEKKKMVEA